jgi:addiction module RelB/DinJ family antitoxin
MAQQTDLTVTIDSDLKASGEALFSNYGFTMSTGLNALLKDAVEHGKMPIDEEANDDYIPRASTIEELKQMVADYDAGHIKAYSLEEIKREADVIHG